jgi:two-component system nitrogen regulation sensor histidine kinase GlnL
MAVERLFESFASHHDPAELLDALATGVVLLDAGRRVVHANIAAQGLLAIGLNQARGRNFTDLFADSNGLHSLLVRALESGEAFTECELSLRPAGTPRESRLVDLSITPLDGPAGLRRLLLEMSDAAPRSRLNRDTSLRSRLEGSRMMTRQLAHEVKNPLGGLRGAAQLLAKELPDPQLREYTNVIIAEADRLTALVDTMMSSARPSRKSSLNIHEVCEYVYRLLTAEAPSGVTIERDYDPSVPEGSFDRDQLVQALLNLARNALQAVGATGKVVLRTRAVSHIHIGLVRHRLAVRIDIVDDGPGVPEEIRSTLFFPLVTARAEGTGLGLAVSQELVTRNDGVIEFESETGRTVFSVLLPLETSA